MKRARPKSEILTMAWASLDPYNKFSGYNIIRFTYIEWSIPSNLYELYPFGGSSGWHQLWVWLYQPPPSLNSALFRRSCRITHLQSSALALGRGNLPHRIFRRAWPHWGGQAARGCQPQIRVPSPHPRPNYVYTNYMVWVKPFKLPLDNLDSDSLSCFFIHCALHNSERTPN